MTDTKRSCLGFFFLITALGLAGISLFWGGVGWLVEGLGGGSIGLDLRSGTILGVGFFAFFFILAVYMFITIKDYSWFPALLAGAYSILPDFILGPEDDILALIIGAGLSGILAWRKTRIDKLQLGEGKK